MPHADDLGSGSAMAAVATPRVDEVSPVMNGVDWLRPRLLLGGAAVGVTAASVAAIRDGELGGPPQTIRGSIPWQEGAADAPPGASGSGYVYFTPSEAAFIAAAVTHIGASSARPSPLAMPSFAWKLDDQEVADVLTFIRNSWGNQAPAVSASDVGVDRTVLGMNTIHLTVNSDDQN